MDLRNKTITVGELLDDPRSKAVFQRRFGKLLRHPMAGAARVLTLKQLSEMAAVYLPQKTIQDMEELYLDAQRSVQKEIESWYARFAVNNQISLTDARKWLTAGQLEEFHWSVEQYIKIGEQAGLDAAWLKKLENASARFHISRLEADRQVFNNSLNCYMAIRLIVWMPC